MEKLRFSHFGGTMKNEVVPTSAPHKIAGNYFSAEKKIFAHVLCMFLPPKRFSDVYNI